MSKTYAVYYAGRFCKRFNTYDEAIAYGIDQFGRGSKNWENGWKVHEVEE